MPLTATKPTKYHFSKSLPLLRLQAGRYGQVLEYKQLNSKKYNA
jgi:hypothetical protein